MRYPMMAIEYMMNGMAGTMFDSKKPNRKMKGKIDPKIVSRTVVTTPPTNGILLTRDCRTPDSPFF
ncbi:hypothetical protein D3C87_2112610 [compost metagenome]